MMGWWLARAALAGIVGAQVITPPAIGGSPAAFEQVIGAPNDASVGPQFHYLRCAGTDIDQFVVLAPNDQVWTIERQYCASTLRSPDERFVEAVRLLPADAVPGDAITTRDGD